MQCKIMSGVHANDLIHMTGQERWKNPSNTVILDISGEILVEDY
ncbi:hypothetical protein [Lihuaxuella thermophila]|nr:hypothetical protein [Lihuaxuella thermophila]